MFRNFFMQRRWLHWSLLGSVLILATTWYKVQLDVKVNNWFGDFYNLIQKALATPHAVSQSELFSQLWVFIKISVVYVLIAIVLEFYIRHYVFRWRTAMHQHYCRYWHLVHHIEGASQRVQEDTMRFARIMEGLGVSLLHSVMTLIAFQPLLWNLSKHVSEVPLLGEVPHILIYSAMLSAICGTVLLAIVGIKLPGLEFNNQKAEAALRKELVLGEDDPQRASPMSLHELFDKVRHNYVQMYRHYLYFDLAKWSYLQFSSILPYVILVPTIVSGVITLGVLQQIQRAFSKVVSSLEFLVRSWSSIVELISVYKRLHTFELQIAAADNANNASSDKKTHPEGAL
ncbi:putative transporter [Iodobacter ciconiae]|uniref:Putative transporter n=1 Tax=Iodobacter ciconiae TaxID=2496266 RepID=A0A3S8ZUL2_9NEIS|nr:putative transporter [Iodobacter ciconiae]AZN37151.1 putative transporter [Iodobacter ciconiae]